MESKTTDQIAIDFQPDGDNSFSKHNSFMFIEDMSFSKYRIKEKYLTTSLNYESPEEVVEFLANKISIFRFRNRWDHRLDLKESLLDLIETISSKLATGGLCVLEKVKENDELIGLRIIRGNVKVKHKKVIQLIPKEIAYELDCKTEISIPKTKCFIVEFPKEICSSSQYREVLKQMSKIDEKDPMFSILNPSNLSEIKGYDPIKHRENLDISLRQLTREVSWHHREQYSSKENYSNYYSILKSLKFIKTKIILLNHIFDFIESMIGSVFKEAKLKIEYSKSLAEINEIIQNYENGKFSHELHLKIIQEYSL